jgi:hypothetical protein
MDKFTKLSSITMILDGRVVIGSGPILVVGFKYFLSAKKTYSLV